LPFDNARFLPLDEASGPDLDLVEPAVADFKSGHPHLLFDKREIVQICRRAIKNPKLLSRLQKSLREKNPAPVGQELRTSIKQQTRRLIHTSFLALISDGTTRGDALHATRCALARFIEQPSWRVRPVIRSFLDCAEIAVAVALAYDWLYGELSDDERQTIEHSLLRHVLEPALAAYQDKTSLWPKRRDNCAIVSNSGILISALAVLKPYPEIAIQLIRKSVASSWNIFEAFAPDGAWPEGLSYWSLVTRYASLMVAALENTLGHSFGLADRPGFAQTGDFALHAVGPFGAAFNFGDSATQFDVSPLAWFAHRFRRPMDARLISRYDGWYLPFAMIWPEKSKAGSKALEPRTGKVFHSNALACFRNTWSIDPAARPVYLAIKGSNVPGSRTGWSVCSEDVILHAQADAGSFIIDGARQRWIIDLGADDYDLPGYFDHGADSRSGRRWRYYRTQTAGHNTLVIDGHNQIPNVQVPIIGNCVEGDCKWAVFDLSAAYGRPAGSIRRGAALIGRQVLIQDEVGPEVSGIILWAAHTTAEPVSVAGSVARFRLGDDRFVARILEPATATFELAFPPEPRSFPIADVRQLHGRSAPVGDEARVIELPRRDATGALIRRLQIAWPTGTRRLSVVLLPDCEEDDLALPVAPLDHWLSGRPVRLAYCPLPTYSHPTDDNYDAEWKPSAVLPTLDAGSLGKHSPERIEHV
jgi:hypothetical protein